MKQNCIDCGRKVEETVIDPRKKESHGAGIWQCDCGTTMRNNLPAPDRLKGRQFYTRTGRSKKLPIILTFSREGQVIKEFAGNHARMY